MPERPTHALTVRPALVELPLWLAWRTAQGAQHLRRHVALLAERYIDPDPQQVRVTAPLVLVACALYSLVSLVGQLIT